MPETPQKALADLVAELEEATREHERAEKAESAAQSAACNAVNRLNAAQKAVDAHLEALREKAPHRSDWSTSKRRREAVTHA